MFCFNVGDKIEQINEVLVEVKTPHFIHRQIKSLRADNFNYKSSEIRVFLFYQAVPIFFSFLPPDYFYLLLTYVTAIRILYEPIKSASDINYTEELIEDYVFALDEYFGTDSYNYTVHAHLHLAEQVRNHGLLHGHSQFVFEVT